MTFTEPDASKTRKWTDRSGTFTVIAEFLALTDGKIHLHKQNGVKIAVPVTKMSIEDLEYVERATGVSLDEDKPLSDIKRRSHNDRGKSVGASVKAEPDYDWFDFFLKAGVGPHLCERYAHNFSKDSMDESVLPDITPEVLRTLGLKEGDVLRVMKYLDEKFSRNKSGKRGVTFGGDEVIGEGEGGLFTGPGGTLRNNTRKGRPAPAVQTNDVVDASAFAPKDEASAKSPSQGTPTDKVNSTGFEDDAWEVKTSNKPAATPSKAATPAAPAQQPLGGAMADLSLLQTPLEPSKTATSPQTTQPAISQAPAQAEAPKTGANPAFFAQLPPQTTSQPTLQPPQMQGLTSDVTGYGQQQQSAMPPRQRPQPPPNMNQGSLLPPPPQRPLSAPNNPQQPNAFGSSPLQPQLTGVPTTGPHIAPAGHSLAELNQQRLQQQQQLQQQPTGFPMANSPYTGQMGVQQTGFMPQNQQQQQPFMQTSSPFMQQQQPIGGFPTTTTGVHQTSFQALAPQPTAFSAFPPQQPTSTGVNSSLPPALQPQRTGINGFGTNPSFTPSPPPIPQQQTPAPLQAQKTGPPPPVRFGVRQDAKKIAPQPTGMKANLSQASKLFRFSILLVVFSH